MPSFSIVKKQGSFNSITLTKCLCYFSFTSGCNHSFAQIIQHLMYTRLLLFAVILLSTCFSLQAQPAKILFDASKAETAGSADWIIDADINNLGYGSGPAIVNTGNESNAQRIPTPAQSGINSSTAETYWQGALSFWGIDCVNKGYTVETLPYNGKITYGDAGNLQDLSNYKVYIVCEPNILFTAAEKTAILDFVAHGGGLFMISDHTISDRNNDGFDSPVIWNDLLQNNSTGNNNPFGIIFDLQNFSQQSANIASLPANDSILHGPMGNVTRVQWNGGTTMTIDPLANASVKAIVYQNNVSGATGNNNIMVACARYGFGKVVAIGDSSPCDDGTGDVNDVLFTGYNVDVAPNHRNLLMNSTIWLANKEAHNYIFAGNGNWNVPENWRFKIVPPAFLETGDTITINNTSGGECLLNGVQYVSPGGHVVVLPGKSLVVPGYLKIQ